MTEENVRFRDHRPHRPEELSFYSKATTDVEYLFPFGWGELWGIADRTDYDLKRHQEHSGKDLTYFDQEENRRYIPYVIEPSLGADRMALAFLCDAYDEEVVGQDKNGKDDIRVVLHLHPALAPFKAAVLPLSKKLAPKAQEIHDMLSKHFMVDYDEAGSIGKRYRRQDEIGTPLCITIDFDTVGDGEKEPDNCVTSRKRWRFKRRPGYTRERTKPCEERLPRSAAASFCPAPLNPGRFCGTISVNMPSCGNSLRPHLT